MENDVYIQWLGSPQCGDRCIAGGKASRLSSLMKEHNVPPGFCVCVDAHKLWQSGSAQPGVMPAELKASILCSYRELCMLRGVRSLPVAVRSSSVSEDSSGFSFAGLYETALNVTGGEEVFDAVISCWTSAGSEAVYSYIRNNRMSALPGMAVLVQEFIPGDSAAVAFSVNPVTANPNQIIINANWGLGSSIVAGTSTPDHYVVSRSNFEIVERRVVEKLTMSVPRCRSGVAEIEVQKPCRQVAALQDKQIKEVAALAADLERSLGFPVDIETTYKDGELFLLQCRPVTALGN